MIIEDFFPSLLEMAGVKQWQVPQTVDGCSFVPLLRGKTAKSRPLIWNCPNIWDNSGPGIGATCTIRQGDWKLIYYYENGKKELYDVAHDIGETHDLSTERTDVVKRLSATLGRRLRAMNAQRPTFKSTGAPCPWPDEI